jgi:hypothetical protein
VAGKRSICLIEANPVDQVRKAGIVAQRIREGLHFKPLQNGGFLLVGWFEPGVPAAVAAGVWPAA